MTLRQQGKGERPNDLQFDALKQFYSGKYVYVHAHTQVALQKRGWFEGGRLTQAGKAAYRHECINRRKKAR